MCCSVSPGVPVRFSDTVLYASEVVTDGEKVVHVLGYQNIAQNGAGQSSLWSAVSGLLPLGGHGNAMILPFPAVPGTMTQANILDTKGCRYVLQDMAHAVAPERRMISRGNPGEITHGAETPRVQVFKGAGIYTIVLAQDPRDIPAALDRVPRSKRPVLNPSLFDTYARWYPGWTIALCCFNNRRAKLAHPMLWWYEPMQPDRLFLPALDGHTGDVPRLEERVFVDHALAVGSYRMRRGAGVSVSYRDALSSSVAPYVLKTLVGRGYGQQTMSNGDFVCEVTDVREGIFRPTRNRPPGAIAEGTSEAQHRQISKVGARIAKGKQRTREE
jgi:hypothetical protein